MKDDDPTKKDGDGTPIPKWRSAREVLSRPAWRQEPDGRRWRYTGGTETGRPNTWVYIPESFGLRYEPASYEIELCTIRGRAALLETILHMAEKRWTQETNVLSDLVQSLTAICGSAARRNRPDRRPLIDRKRFNANLALGRPMFEDASR